MHVPFKKVNLGKANERLAPLLASGSIGLGEVVYEFEKKLAKYVGAEHVVATDSCTSAIFLTLLYQKRYRGLKKVSIPSMTVPLVPAACIEAGIEIEFDGRTKWVGTSYELLGSQTVDSAHHLYEGQYATEHQGKYLCYSFYPTKTIGSADGGAIATDDEHFADWARKIVTYGRNQRQQYGNSWDYEIEMVGYKRHWTNLQAAIALEQLERLNETEEKRQMIREFYDSELGIMYKNGTYLYRIYVEPDNKQFISYLKEHYDIECGIHFKPLHKMTPYKDISMDGQAKKYVDKIYDRTVSLPYYDTMTVEEMNHVSSAIMEGMPRTMRLVSPGEVLEEYWESEAYKND